MGLLDRIKALPSNPLAMASLGLLSMPTRSRYPINPMEYAMNGMQMGIQNQQAQQQMEAEKQAQLMREQEYKLRVSQYQQEQYQAAIARAQEAAQRQRQEEYLAQLTPEQQAIARVMGPGKYAGELLEQSRPQHSSLPAGYKLDEKGNRVIDPEYWAMKKDVAANARAESPYYQFLPGADGYLVGNARTGQIAPGLVNGQRAIPGALDPALQQQLASGKAYGADMGTAQAGRETRAVGLPEIISKAETLLTGETKPTSSGLGAAYDAAAGLVGSSPKGAKEAAQLKSLGGALVSKMPRMEGPQGVLDVQLYQEMAGKVGDPTIPIEQRQAALEVVKELYAKYATKSDVPTPSAGNDPLGLRK